MKPTTALAILLCALPLVAHAADPLRIGLIVPLTGPFASTGKQIEAAARLYVATHGDTVAGRKVELIVKDDAGVADSTRRIAQDLVVNEKVDVLAGFGLTPLAMATVAPFCAIHSLAAASICRPVEADWPVIGRMKPILKGAVCASAGANAAPLASANAVSALSAARRDGMLFVMESSSKQGQSGGRRDDRGKASAAATAFPLPGPQTI